MTSFQRKEERGRGAASGSFGAAFFTGEWSAAFAVVEGDVIEDVEVFIDPGFGGVIPPGVFVHEDDADPAVEGFFDALVGLAGLGPAEEFDEFVSGESDTLFGEVIAAFGELDEADHDLVVGGGGQAVFLGAHDGEASDDGRPVALFEDVFEDHGELTVGDTVGEGGDGEFGEVEFVLVAEVGGSGGGFCFGFGFGFRFGVWVEGVGFVGVEEFGFEGEGGGLVLGLGGFAGREGAGLC